MRRFAGFLVVVLIAMVVAIACGSSDPAPIPDVRQVRAERDLIEGEAQLTSTVTVEFDRRFELAESRVPLASKFEFDVPDLQAGATHKRVLVREAQVQPGNGRVIVLNVDALIPDGSTIKVAKSTFRRSEPGELDHQVQSDLRPEQVPLAATAFGVTRPGLFAEPVPAPPATDADRDPAAQRDALARHLRQRGSPEEVVTQALDRYDAMPSDRVASPKLRAALAALTGTFADPAIEDLLTAANCTGVPAARIAFEVPPDEPDLFARVTFVDDGARVVSVSPVLEGERFERLMPVLAHEAVHCDQEDGKFEEVAATAFDTFLWAQLVAADPSLAEGGTTLVHELNIDAVAMFNSGRRLPESLGLLPSVGVQQALPFTTAEYRSFADLVADAYSRLDNSAPQEPLAREYVKVLAAATGHAEGDPFNLLYLDELVGRATSPALLAALLQVYELAPVG